MEDYEGQDGAATVASLKQYLWSIVYMPSALRSDIIASWVTRGEYLSFSTLLKVALPD